MLKALYTGNLNEYLVIKMNTLDFLEIVDTLDICDEARTEIKEKLEYVAEEQQKAHAEKKRKSDREYRRNHPQDSNKRERRKGGKDYEARQKYETTGLQGRKKKIRMKHAKKWRRYKQIVAPESQCHHEWISGTSQYRGVALVEKDQHIHGMINVIRILEGKITLFTEEEVRNRVN